MERMSFFALMDTLEEEMTNLDEYDLDSKLETAHTLVSMARDIIQSTLHSTTSATVVTIDKDIVNNAVQACESAMRGIVDLFEQKYEKN